MRYREATSRPGRNRPSFSRYSAELELREDGGREDDGGRGGNGDGEVGGKEIVATSSVFSTGAPQAEQKRTLAGSSAAQLKHLAMTNFPLQSTADLGLQMQSWQA